MPVPQLTCQAWFLGAENCIFSWVRCDQWSHFSWDYFSPRCPVFLDSRVSFVTFQILDHTFHLVLEGKLLLFLCLFDLLNFVLFFNLMDKILINTCFLFQDYFSSLYIYAADTFKFFFSPLLSLFNISQWESCVYSSTLIALFTGFKTVACWQEQNHVGKMPEKHLKIHLLN